MLLVVVTAAIIITVALLLCGNYQRSKIIYLRGSGATFLQPQLEA